MSNKQERRIKSKCPGLTDEQALQVETLLQQVKRGCKGLSVPFECDENGTPVEGSTVILYAVEMTVMVNQKKYVFGIDMERNGVFPI